MSGKSSIVGSGSNMSEAMYLKKMESTCIFEDKDLVENYMRSTIKTWGIPDRPSLESDQPRRNNFSEDRLNLRHHGKRVSTEPYLPEGTFLDFHALEKDSRGNALEPNMKLHKDQQLARGKFIKFYSDADNSIPGEGRNQARVISDIKGQFYRVKEAMKIFEESQDSRHNGGTSQILRTNKVNCLQEQDGREREMVDAMCYNKTNVVNDLSNNTSVGWRRTTDHRFQIAKYGQVKKVANRKDHNYNKNRSNAYVEHDILVSWKDQNVSKSLGLKMIDLARKKENTLKFGDAFEFGKSEDNKLRKRKLTPDDLSGIQARQTEETQADTANVVLNGTQTNVLSRKTAGDLKRKDKGLVDMYIINYMANNNRRLTTKVLDDLRSEILQSSAFVSLLLDQKNKMSSKAEIKNELLWDSVANFERGKSMNMQNYSSLVHERGAKNQNNIDYEDYKTDQKLSEQRRGNIDNPTQYIFDSTEFDNEAGMEAVGTKLIGGMGSKYMRNHIDEGDIEYNNNEIMARNSRK